MSKKMKSNLLLFLTAFIWGTAFVAQKSGMDYIEPFTYGGIRQFLGGLVLIPVIIFLDSRKPAEEKNRLAARTEAQKKAEDKILLIGGICCGLALFVAGTLQQFGIAHTTAGKAGFITTLYVVIVPIFSIFLRKKVKPIMWFCVMLGALGLYMLCMKDATFTIQYGDFLVLLCAVAFAVHILVIDYFSPKADGVKLSCIQFLVAGILGIICMFIFETPTIENILAGWFPIVYAAVFSSGVAYTLQIVAQKDADPTAASLILSLESVFAALAGMMLLHESMTAKELLGCVIIFAAIIIAQLPSKEERLAAKGGN
ncbi:MAG: DMT family transporter [Firmicutes bacterium]|nr:DMT family transporter [Bacillota bacterium]